MTASGFPPGPSASRVHEEAHRGMDFLARCFDEFGDVFHIQRTGTHLFYFRHPDHIRHVLIPEASRFTKRQDLVPYLGKGLLTSDGDLWRRQRRLIQPAFHSERIAAYAGGMVEEAQKLASSWRSGQTRDITHEMMRVTLAIVCRALFGHDTSKQTEDVARVMQIYQSSASSGWGNEGFQQALTYMNHVVTQMIEDRRAQTETTDDLLSWLLQATDEYGTMGLGQLKDELLTFFLAGHETTSQALTWTWYLLSRHRAVERKVHAELDAVLAGRTPTLADIEHLRYLDRVANEALRLYPPAYTLPRLMAVDTEIAGWKIPSGAQVLLCTFLCHRDPRWFPNPERFDPDRWLEGSGGVLDPDAFFPFGAGPRTCVGKHFARLEMLLVLATIAGRFRLVLDSNEEIAPVLGITLHPSHAIPMSIRRRRTRRNRRSATRAIAKHRHPPNPLSPERG